MGKRIVKEKIQKLCECNEPRITIRVEVIRVDPVGHAQLFVNYDTCPDCATCLSEGSMKKEIKTALIKIIKENKRET